jgi:hypothetical protein
MDELLKITTDPFLAQQNTTDAFVGIVANFWEHFEPQIGTLESFSIINGQTPETILIDLVRHCHCSRFSGTFTCNAGI